MKVLFINETCGRGSHGRICTDIADIITENGGQCKIGYGRDTVPDNYQKYAIRIGNSFDIYIHVLGSRVFDNTGFYSAGATKEFIHKVEEFNPDIIHLHNLHGYYINIKLLFEYFKTCGKPIIWTLHDCWPFTGHCTCSDYIGCDKWKTGCFRCPQKTNYPTCNLVDNSRGNFKKKKELFTKIPNLYIVTPSIWLKGQVEASFLYEYPVRVIESGIDLRTFKPSQGNFRGKYHLENKTVLLSVANAWSDRKGLAEYYKLSEMLDDSYQLVMVGNLRGEALPQNTLHIEHTNNQQELAEIYTESDVYLNFSCEETQGLTTVEALACGTPVLVIDRTAIAECVNDSCGVVLKAFDEHTMLDDINTAKYKEKEACLAQAAKYEKGICFEKYIAFYEELVK